MRGACAQQLCTTRRRTERRCGWRKRVLVLVVVGGRAGGSWAGGESLRRSALRQSHTRARAGACRDSVDDEVLRDRERHAARIEACEYDERVLEEIGSVRLGRYKRYQNQKGVCSKQAARAELSKVESIGRSLINAPSLNHEALPEVVLAGHSNVGKSSLLNALTGLPAARGLAGVHPRAGWTDSIYMFEARVRETRLVLVDTPGYGVAVVKESTRVKWAKALDEFVLSSAHARALFLLVDCTRGLCALDEQLLRRAEARALPCQLVLTKADLLTPEDLARSHAVVSADLRARAHGTVHPPPALVSANFFQGVRQLWGLVAHYSQREPTPPAVSSGARMAREQHAPRRSE